MKISLQANQDPRRIRNDLLASTDWTQVPDSPLSEEQKQAYRTYRQALRDMTFTGDIIWPKKP